MINESNIKIEQLDNSSFFLPDFCHVRSVFMVILVSELLAFILTLVHFRADVFWLELGRYSLVIQWIALLSTAMLCMSRPLLRKLNDVQSGLLSYLMVLLVTLIVTIGATLGEAWLQGSQNLNVFDYQGIYTNLLMAAILSGVMLRFFYLQAQYHRRIIIAADAKLQALQARIHPHFLFNSMNTIAGLIPIDPEGAERVIEDLSDLFRASLAEHRSEVSLASEIDLCKRYMGIEQLRLGERLKTTWLLPESLGTVKIPPLTLQPLIENAIYHGIQPLVEGGEVSVEVLFKGPSCIIHIENPMAELTGLDNTTKSGNQIALDNVRERLAMLYQERANLQMSISPSRCIVTLTLPSTPSTETDHENSNR